MQINGIALGDEKKFPAIKSLIGIFKDQVKLDKFKKSEYKYCLSTINEYHRFLNKITILSSKDKRYLYRLIKYDFLDRLDDAKISQKVHSHMRNLIVAIHNEKVKDLK